MSHPAIGETVHYVSYGTPGGEYESTCRAAIVTEVDTATGNVGLCVLNPTGIFLNRDVEQYETPFEVTPPPRGGTWHWPCTGRTEGAVDR